MAVFVVDACVAMREAVKLPSAVQLTSQHLRPDRNIRRIGLLYQQPMKSKLSLITLSLLMCVSVPWSPAAFAQQPPGGKRFWQGARGARWANLSEDERAKLKAAHRQALTDPGVRAARERLKQARREFREVMQPALLKADPSIQPILDKVRATRLDRQ